MKSARFHEICRISKLWAFAWWSSIGLLFFERPIRRGFAETSDWSFNRKTYTWSSPKSSRSWNLADFTMKSGGFHHEIWQISWNPWNLADFTMKSGGFQVKSDVSEISCRCFSKNSSDFTRFGVDFTWNLLDFMKSARFHLKSAGFHTDFMKSGGFHEIHEIWQISPWNLVDFRWNQMFQKSAADVSAKTLLILQVWGGFHLKSAGFHMDFIKSGRFHVKSKDLCKEL